jgi:uncharacterized protein YdaU (DUF1376 family)
MNYYKHHIGDYDSHTAHLTLVEDAIYHRLLALYYRTEKPLPVDIAKVCRLIRVAADSERETVKSVLHEFFGLADDGWHHGRCDAEIAKANALADKSREVGKTGGRPKKSETPEVLKNNPPGFETETPGVSEIRAAETLPTTPHPTTHYPLEEGASASPPPTPRGSRLQPDFEPDMEIKTALIAERPDLDYSRVIEGFRDYWLSQPGAKGVKLDWNRTFRKWWREQRAQTGPKAAKFDSGHAPTSFSDTPWRLRLKGYHESNFWLPSFGPKPGEPGCEVPKKFLDEFSSLNRLKGAA